MSTDYDFETLHDELLEEDTTQTPSQLSVRMGGVIATEDGVAREDLDRFLTEKYGTAWSTHF